MLGRMRFIHTSDWQIGEVFRQVDDATMAVLQTERLEAIGRLGRLAREQRAPLVLVAGDVYDSDKPSDRTLEQPIERMRAFPDLRWHLLPGNHDGHQPNGLWDRLRKKGLPDNIVLHLESGPHAVEGESAVLLPAPLTRRHSLADPTEYMDGVATPDDVIRIGLAHGSIAEFGSDGLTTHNKLDPARAERARLAYLALGDWHRQRCISDRVWYSGTPEPDGFDEDAEGLALLVEIEGARALPRVTPLPTGRFRWMTLAAPVNGEADVTALDGRLRGLDADLARVLLHLKVEGALTMQQRVAFDERIAGSIGAALRYLRLDDTRLGITTTAEDLDAIDHAGFVRAAAETLRAKAADAANPEREIAALALQRLYVLHRRGGAA
jgi:DNA repair exonuclease SbcCD nuclease subunit